ncbi:protein kinase domain-containing protein [Nocardioides sp. MAHUQ-72]|uniref:serine/threonine-protein kinase n=1 Tax=unclassified Nocardioides TaxID=2615069 RepID=UPI00360A5614
MTETNSPQPGHPSTPTPSQVPSQAPAPAAPPPLAGRYVLVDQIGAGGMGSVWRAWDLRTGRFVAAKVLGQHDGGMLLRFVREQSVRIQHPHVVAPSGWAAEDNLVVFTMDLVRGGSVQTLLGDHGPLPESYVAVVLDQTLQALEAIHGAGVVHRDIKPANLLLEATGTRRPVVRVGDFGVAALVDDVRLTRFPGAIGTDGYMAPEQVRGAAPDPRQDLYATGVVAIQMLTGLSPRQQQGAPPGVLKPLLDAMTSAHVEQRPPSASAALDYLRRLGVPPGAPWQDDPEPPEVFDQLGDVAVPAHAPASGTPSGAPSGAPAPGAASYGAGSFGASGPSSAPPAGPPSGSWGPPAQEGPATTVRGAAPAAGGSTATLIAIACFVVALVLSAVALYLVVG